MANEQQGQCPICRLDGQQVRESDGGERLNLECARCGKFTITATAARHAERKELGAKLSAWIRDRTESGADVPEINMRSLTSLEATFPSYRVSEKQLLLLRALEKKTAFPGQCLDVVADIDYPIAWAAGTEELLYLLRSLGERGLIRRTDGKPDLADSFVFKFEITASGWEFLEQHSRPSAISNQAFVAMSFASELKPIWENGIRVALANAGFKPYRVDTDLHIERIDAKIISEIKNSRFLVADVTQQRPGVYFEAGYAIGIGIPAFWRVHKDDLKNVHFDTRQYNHIVWENHQHLAEQLESFVTAVIGKGTAN